MKFLKNVCLDKIIGYLFINIMSKSLKVKDSRRVKSKTAKEKERQKSWNSRKTCGFKVLVRCYGNNKVSGNRTGISSFLAITNWTFTAMLMYQVLASERQTMTWSVNYQPCLIWAVDERWTLNLVFAQMVLKRPRRSRWRRGSRMEGRWCAQKLQFLWSSFIFLKVNTDRPTKYGEKEEVKAWQQPTRYV